MNVMDNTKHTTVDISSSGDNEVIAAPTGTGVRIAIDHLNFVPTGAVDVILKTGSTALSGAYPLDAKQAYTIENVQNKEKGILYCGANEAFNINLGTATQVSGFVQYRILNK